MKRIHKGLILTVLTLILLNVFAVYSQAGEMAIYAHKSYDEIMTESASDLVGRKFTDYLSSGDDNFRLKCERFLCIEKPAATSWQNFYIYAILDIDGGSPTTGIYTTASGSKTVTHNDIATIAYIAYAAERDDDDGGSYSISKAYAYVMNDLRNSIDSSIPYSTDSLKNDYVNKGRKYRDEVIAGTAEEVYSARILIFQGGSMQTTAMLYGKAGTNGTITINKYISNASTDRSGMSENDKKNSPANFAPQGDLVTFNIVVSSTYTSAVSVTINDVFENNKENGGLIIADYSGWTRNAANSYTTTVNVPARSSTTVSLTVRTYSNLLQDTITDYTDILDFEGYTETYKNTVTITSGGTSVSKDKSSDYVRVGASTILEPVTTVPSGNIQKYVSAVNNNPVGGRENRSKDDKYQDPVVVKQGDIVTYTIEVENTSKLEIYSCNMTDIAESGLTIIEANNLTGFSMNSEETYITTVKVRVDKSNMYLYNLENDITFVDGKYTRIDTYTYTDLSGKVHTFTVEVLNTPIPESVRNEINSGNMDKDYVRLKELIIAGDVWLDSNKNGLLQDETKLKDIVVILQNVTDGTNMRTTTDANGHYSFSGFYKGTGFTAVAGKTGYYPTTATHKEYYVEFNYDGVRYISTAYSGRTNLKSDNSYNDNYLIDSNATEYTKVRDRFNKSFETISYNKATGAGIVNDLSFTKNGHTSMLDWTESTTMAAYSFVKDPNAETKDNLFLSHSGKTDYIEHINLGLVEREKVDLRVTKDLLEAQVRINGYTMDYEFGKLDQNALYQNDDFYKLYVYKSDYEYRYDMYENQTVRGSKGEASELQVDLSYKITLYNESPDDTYAVVNEVIDFYTNEMSLKPGAEVYMIKNDTRKTLDVKATSDYNGDVDYSFDGYRTVFLTGMDDVLLLKGEKVDIFLTYTVDKNTERYLYLGEKINVAQIGAYSTYTDATLNTPLGLVDTDSNAGNVNKNCTSVTDVDNYEDNVFRSKLKIEFKPIERQVTGFVFEDARSDKVLKFNHFTGNGTFNLSDERNNELVALFTNGMKKDINQDLGNDTKLDGMTVELVEIVTVGDEIFEETIDPLDLVNKGNVIVRTQTSGGEYTLDSFIPGTYVVRFRYGDIFTDGSMTQNSLVHNGQDYKSTTYTLTAADGVTVLENTANNDEKYAALVAENKSDARDNEFRRIEIMAESEVMIHEIAEFMKYTNYETSTIGDDLKEFVRATNAFADTVTVSLGIENKADTVNGNGVRVAYRNFDEIALAMPHVDYGVVFRPENFIEMTKTIKKIKLVDSTERVLLEIDYNMDGDIVSEIGSTYVQAIDTIGTTQGFRYINIDEDVLQGATLSVEYYIMADNIGEVDTVTEFLRDEGGSEAILAKLNARREVIQSVTVTEAGTGTKDNYVRVSNLINDVYGKTYNYGLFVGDIYYRGVNGNDTNIVAVPVTVNKILDFIDNDATFVQENNSETGKYWAVITENELRDDGYVSANGLFRNSAGDRYYKDEENRKYTTDERKNLVVSAHSVYDNPTLVVPIVPEYLGEGDTRSYIVVQMDAVLGGDNESENMVYENIAEIIEFVTPVGRRTNFASTIGNMEINGTVKPFAASQKEVDSDGTEVIRLTPPTGLTRVTLFVAGNKNVIVVITGVLVLLVIAYVAKFTLYGKVGKTRFYK